MRLQIDNCLRTYAAFIAEDRNKVIDCIINGKRIDKEKDTHGYKMTDGYLKKKLEQMDASIAIIYNNAIEFQVGSELPEKRNPILVEMLEAFIHFVKLHYKMIIAVVESKKRYDLKNNN